MFYIYIRGLIFGISIYNVSLILDTTLCNDTFKELINTQGKLYIQGVNKCFINLVYISPLFYTINNYYFVNNIVNNFEILNIIYILLGHNIYYYIAHMMMHKINCIRFIHEFHHKFEKKIVPSIGNAVSEYEFLFAYLSPFIILSYIIKPTQLSLDISIAIIAILNMFLKLKF